MKQRTEELLHAAWVATLAEGVAVVLGLGCAFIYIAIYATRVPA